MNDTKKRTNRAIAICALFTKMQVFEKSFENSVSFSTFFALYIVGEDIILPQTVVENHLITRFRGSFPSRGSLTQAFLMRDAKRELWRTA